MLSAIINAVAVMLGSGGLFSALAALYRLRKSHRAGARTNINDLVDDLNEARKSAEAEQERLRALMHSLEGELDQWRNTAWGYAKQLMHADIDPIPPYGQHDTH